MMKTLIYPLWVRWKTRKNKFINEGNSFKGFVDEEMYFPLNHIIPFEVSNDDDITVILLKIRPEERSATDPERLARDEVSRLISCRCHSLDFKVLESDLDARKTDIKEIYSELCRMIPEKSDVYADVTFGPKYVPLLLFCVLNYAEKYLGCEIQRLVYGNYDVEKKKPGVIIDFTPLYLLNTLGSIFDGTRENFDNFARALLK